MAKFYTLGCYTAKGLAGFVSNPSTDRKAATSALAASVGAKVTQYSGLRGKYDFMAVIEGTFEQAAAAAMVAVSSGAVSDFTILEDVDLNEIAKTAQKMASSYKEPHQSQPRCAPHSRQDADNQSKQSAAKQKGKMGNFKKL